MNEMMWKNITPEIDVVQSSRETTHHSVGAAQTKTLVH